MKKENAQKMQFGHFNEFPVGTIFKGRKLLKHLGLHFHIQNGISYTVDDAADAIVLSGGYIDDEDRGDSIVYTGMGGRSTDGRCQIQDQTFTKGNRALLLNHEQNIPVRVFSHVEGISSDYLYRGLYEVNRCWLTPGQDGFNICRYQLNKIDELAFVHPDHTHLAEKGIEHEGIVLPTKRKTTTHSFIVRDIKQTRKVKNLYQYACQICGVHIENFRGKKHADGAHIRGLGTPHHGPDVSSNILCLCPNHHKMFDFGSIVVRDDLKVIDLLSGQETDDYLYIKDDHRLDREQLKYHYDFFTSLKNTYLDEIA